MKPRLSPLLPVAALAAVALQPVTAETQSASTCTLSAQTLLQAYGKAKDNGFRFECMDTLESRSESDVWADLGGNVQVPVLAQPSGEIACVGKSRQKYGKITGGFFANKMPFSGREHLTALRNGWELVDFTLDGAASFGGYTVPAHKIGVVRFRVTMPNAGKNFAFKVSRIRIKKTGGVCANAVAEAFGPELGKAGESVCDVNIASAYAKAIQRGYSFECFNVGNNPAKYPPLPLGPSLQCAGNAGSQYGLSTFFFRNSQTGTSSLKNGWRVLSYTVSGASNFGGYWERDQGLVSYAIRMKQGSAFGVSTSGMKLAKAGGDCAKVLDEAF